MEASGFLIRRNHRHRIKRCRPMEGQPCSGLTRELRFWREYQLASHNAPKTDCDSDPCRPARERPRLSRPTAGRALACGAPGTIPERTGGNALGHRDVEPSLWSVRRPTLRITRPVWGSQEI